MALRGTLKSTRRMTRVRERGTEERESLEERDMKRNRGKQKIGMDGSVC